MIDYIIYIKYVNRKYFNRKYLKMRWFKTIIFYTNALIFFYAEFFILHKAAFIAV